MAFPGDDMRPEGAESQVTSYLSQARDAFDAGDVEVSMHLYLAAFSCAMHASNVPNEAAIEGLKQAWSIACALKERALAEHVFEKLEPYLNSFESNHCANQLQALALEKLAQYGLTRDAIARLVGRATGAGVDPGRVKLVSLDSFRIPVPGDAAHGAHEEGTEAARTEENQLPVDGDAENATDSVSVDKQGETDLLDVDEGTAAATVSEDGEYALEPSLEKELEEIMAQAGAGAFAAPKVPEEQGESMLKMLEEAVKAAVDQSTADKHPKSQDPKGEGPVAIEADGDLITGIKPARDPETGLVVSGDYDPEASPKLTDEGLSLGPNFGIRRQPAKEDADGNRFNEMIESLGKMMAEFEMHNGEQMVSNVPENRQAARTFMPGELPETATYADLVGYDHAIDVMRSFGIGMRDDPDYLDLVDALNQLHGIDHMPATDSLLFRALSRDDASNFMMATANELDLPMLRMSMDESLQGAFMLCLSVRADKAPQMNRQRNEFEGPAVLCLEDIDLWMSPMDYYDEEGVPWPQRLTRGARETVQLIRAAVSNPQVYVLATLSSYGEIDPFFCDLLTPFSMVEIDVPNSHERTDIWKALVRDHPSLGNLRMADLVRYSANMPRSDIYIAVREAIEEAYKQSLAMRTYLPVSTDNLLEKLSAYQPLDSTEYRDLENVVAANLAAELDEFDSVDALLGLGEFAEPDEGPLYGDDNPIDTDNPYFAL